ncbi:MAG TPA: (deoxy)nucleoside triphosphate pyrophosphohydrolase [Anaeromyxobacteraceae bacterium]|nr:(deoxy)nucleoside triphosphate pyrophosphohydrolase [Anaeromyxobacteraceae bacterium]
MKLVQVVAAVIRRDGRILVTRRHGHAERGGQWEFPGGKIEPGEAEPEALVREIREELDCDVEVGALLARTSHRYPDLEVELAFYGATLAPGVEPRLVGAAAMEWAEPSRLATYDFCEADLPVLPVLAGADGGGTPRTPR